VVVVASFLNSRGKFYTSFILFSCCQWKQKFLFKVSLLLVSVRLRLQSQENVKPSSVESSFKARGPMAAECVWNARKKGFRDDC